MSILLVFLSGILVSIPFIYPDLFFMSWFALIPFIYSINKSDFRDIFKKGWLLGFLIILTVGYPIYYPVKNFTNFNSLIIIILVMLILIIYSLIYGLGLMFYKLLQSNQKINPFLFSLTWVVIEIFRHLFLGFLPLGYLGYTQGSFNKLIQIADIGGVFLVSFIVVLFNVLIYKIIIDRDYKHIVILIIIFILIISYGNYQINKYNQLSDIIKVGVIQTNIEQKDKWRETNIEKHNDLIINPDYNFEDVSLVITPESALTFDINKDRDYKKYILNKIDDIDRYYQVGFLASKDNYNRLFNSSFLISPQGFIVQRYDKNKLVLFGEKILFEDLFQRFLGDSFVGLKSGEDIQIFKTTFSQWKTLICSEILYPGYVSKSNKDVDFIINQSNEGWFNNDKVLKNQMYTSLVFRAIENRKSIIKSGNKAFGGIIYPSGERIKFETDNIYKIIEVKLNNNESIFNKLF